MAGKKDYKKTKQYKALKKELEDDLESRGLISEPYKDKVDEYMRLWCWLQMLNDDISVRGVFIEYQIGEIERAELRPGEDEELEARRKLLQNAEKLSDALEAAAAALYGDEDSDGAAALLAQAEKAAAMMAAYFEISRRRVYAWEHVLIPQFRDTIRFITMKLEENERGNITRLMKVKDMMLAEARKRD